MPVIAKLSVATALPTVRQLIGDLGKAAAEVGGLAGLEVVTKGVDALTEHSDGKGVEVDLVIVAPADAADAQRASAWVGDTFPPASLWGPSSKTEMVILREAEGRAALRVAVQPLTTVHAQAAGTPKAPVLVLLVGSPGALHADNVSAIERLAEDRPLVVLIGPSSQPSTGELESRVRNLAWSSQLVDIAALPETTLQAQLAGPPWGGGLNLLRAYSTAAGLESLAGVFDLALQQQARHIKVKRSAAQAKLGPVKGAAAGTAKPPAAASDVVNEIKSRVQRHTQEFERGASERLVNLLGPATGTLTRESETLLLQLDDLEEEERSTKVETRIAAEFEERLTRTIRQRISRHCLADVVALNDLFRLLAQEIDRSLHAAQGPPFVAQFAYLTEERVRRLIDMYAIFPVNYRGEMPKRGFGEYFASVRKYSMLLVMGASMFGLSSMMRQYREFTVPATILLVLFGSYSVAASTREQRVENLEKELEAARNSLRPELKKMFGEVQKSWAATLIQFMNEQVAAVLAEIDVVVKEHQARRGADSNPERERLQRQVQALEAAEKKLAAPAKAKDTLLVSVAQVRGELRQLLPRPGAVANVPAGGGALQDARARIDALKAQALEKAVPEVPAGASSAVEAAKARLAAFKAPAPAPATPAAPGASTAANETPKPGTSAPAPSEGPRNPAPPAQPSAIEAAKARLAALKAQAAQKRAAAPALPAEPPKPSATQDAKARFEALKAQAAERRAAKAAAKDKGAKPAEASGTTPDEGGSSPHASPPTSG
jgi:hypothetical protein